MIDVDARSLSSRTFSCFELEALVTGRAETTPMVAKMVGMVRSTKCFSK